MLVVHSRSRWLAVISRRTYCFHSPNTCPWICLLHLRWQRFNLPSDTSLNCMGMSVDFAYSSVTRWKKGLHRSPSNDVAVKSVVPSLHVVVRPDWRHEHGPLMLIDLFNLIIYFFNEVWFVCMWNSSKPAVEWYSLLVKQFQAFSWVVPLTCETVSSLQLSGTLYLWNSSKPAVEWYYSLVKQLLACSWVVLFTCETAPSLQLSGTLYLWNSS